MELRQKLIMKSEILYVACILEELYDRTTPPG